MMSRTPWITDGTGKPFYTRGVITLKDEVKRAEAKVSALGQFVFYANGRKVGDHELDPGWTDYRKTIQYVTFDVTDLLHSGKNVLGAEVGNGWFILDSAGGYVFHFPPFMPKNPNPYRPFGKSLLFFMDLSVTYRDGTTGHFQTDAAWKTAPHEVRRTSIYGSEIVDARYRQDGWTKEDFDDSSWKNAGLAADVPEGILENQFQPAVRVTEHLVGRKTGTAEGGDIYDFSRNTAGIFSFEIRGKRGDTVRFYPAEKLDEKGNADQYAKGWMKIDTVLSYTIGSDHTWENYREKFTYFAGRYIRVETDSPDVEVRDLTMDVITSAWKDTGSFSSDDGRYDGILLMIRRTMEANLLSVHTDCPTIERFAWQEPNHLLGASMMYLKDMDLLYRKFFHDLRDAQHTKDDRFLDMEGNPFCPGDGLVPSQAPCYMPNVLPVPGMGSFYDTIAWGSTIILGVRWHYLFYGDLSVIGENFDAGLRYLNYLKTKMTDEGFICHGLGDWGNPEGKNARENVETALLYADAKTLAWFAELLGRKEAKELSAFAGKVRDNYNRRLLQRMPDGRFAYRDYEDKDRFTVTEGCEALPLYWGMVPKERERDVVSVLRELLEKRGALCAGEITLPYIIETASAHGMNDLISRCIVRETQPSYYAFVKAGETTLGEYWEENPRSHCHDMMGHIAAWYFDGIAGIQPLEPGFSKIRIRPYLPESMNHAACSFDSKSGNIYVELAREEKDVAVKIRTDAGIQVTFDPGAMKEKCRLICEDGMVCSVTET